MSNISQWVYTPEAVRELDRIAIEEQGIPAYELMTRAAQFMFAKLRERFPAAQHWVVLAGSGNNAGDGYVIGQLARAAGMDVTLFWLADPDTLQGSAAEAQRDYHAQGGRSAAWTPASLTELSAPADLLIDALLGTGLKRELEGAYLEAVRALNAQSAPVAAVDIPTGLHGATGEVLGAAVRADCTSTFVGRKQGLYVGAGPDHSGAISFSSLDIAPIDAARVAPTFRTITKEHVASALPPRRRGAHKGDHGHVLVVGGNHGCAGAVRLSGEAALRSGAGLVSVATRQEHVAAIIAGRPELMCRGIEQSHELDELMARASVLAVGPGLGQDDWALEMLTACLERKLPTVVDADALNLLAAAEPQALEHCVLTPHPGEAARLLGATNAAIQNDRPASLKALIERYKAVVLLKGQGTLVGAGSDIPWLIRGGNPGMATAGMGDVLTGVIAALLAQLADSESPADRAFVTALAAHTHAAAADVAALSGERGLVALDVCAALPACLNPYV